MDGIQVADDPPHPVYARRTGGPLYHHLKNQQTDGLLSADLEYNHFANHQLLLCHALQLETWAAGDILHPVARIRDAYHNYYPEKNCHETGSDRRTTAERHDDRHEQSGDHQVAWRRALFLRTVGKGLRTGLECPCDHRQYLYIYQCRARDCLATDQRCYNMSGHVADPAGRTDTRHAAGLAGIY